MVNDNEVVINLESVVGGSVNHDVIISCYHVRQLFGGKIQNSKMTNIKMFDIYFNTCLLPPGTCKLYFGRFVSHILKNS